MVLNLFSSTAVLAFFAGYFERELKADKIEVGTLDIYPEAPAPREMIDLEVCPSRFTNYEITIKPRYLKEPRRMRDNW